MCLRGQRYRTEERSMAFTVSSAPSKFRSTTCTSGMPQHRTLWEQWRIAQPQVKIKLERRRMNSDRHLASSGCQGDAQSAANAGASPSDKDCLTSPLHGAPRLAYKLCFVRGTTTNYMGLPRKQGWFVLCSYSTSCHVSVTARVLCALMRPPSATAVCNCFLEACGPLCRPKAICTKREEEESRSTT